MIIVNETKVARTQPHVVRLYARSWRPETVINLTYPHFAEVPRRDENTSGAEALQTHHLRCAGGGDRTRTELSLQRILSRCVTDRSNYA